MRTLLFLLISFILCAQNIEFNFRIIYLEQDMTDVAFKIAAFSNDLQKQLNAYEWDLPHTDFDEIETNINVNIDKNISEEDFTGMITVSSGPKTKKTMFVPLRKNIYFTEQNISFKIDYEKEPDIDRKDPSYLETIVLFYANLAMGENFDRLSYTDRSNFNLYGDHYYKEVYSFENLITRASDRNEWKKRIELINNYRMGKNIELRRLNALIYNAIYFINTGKSDRAAYFVEPIREKIENISELPDNFFDNNFFYIAEIFRQNKDKYLDFLIEQDPERESFYENKLGKKIKK
ncbi:MAG: hypothetical protein R6V47_01240 [Candidatus Delongbacteria bacterium]